ncbi:hypothetical protein D3C76_1319340 [compost metagenome]
MRLASAEDEQIERQHGKDEHYEGGPHPGLADADGGHLLSPHEAEIGWRSHANEPFTSTKIVYSLRIVRFLRSIDSGAQQPAIALVLLRSQAGWHGVRLQQSSPARS